LLGRPDESGSVVDQFRAPSYKFVVNLNQGVYFRVIAFFEEAVVDSMNFEIPGWLHLRFHFKPEDDGLNVQEAWRGAELYWGVDVPKLGAS
jgi:hypothetical protein